MSSSADVMEIFSSIQGEGLLIGERQLFIRFYGCNRSCAYCDTEAARGTVLDCRIEKTPGHRDFTERTNPLDAEKLVGVVLDIIRQFPFHHSVALTGGEPLLHARFLSDILPMVTRKLPVLLETNGILFDALQKILGWVKIISMDVKLESNTGEEADWESHRLFLKACHGKEVYVKAVVSPEVDHEELRLLIDLLAQTDPSIPLILQPLHGTEGRPEWMSRLMELQAFCRERLFSVRVIPQIHKFLDIP
jgi:organic radical activating enzyme